MVQDLRLPCYLLGSPTGANNVNDTNSSGRECRPVFNQDSTEEEDCAVIKQAPLQEVEAVTATAVPNGQEWYERGTTLKNVGLFKQAADYFEKAAQDPSYALKAFAQMGLSLKKIGKQEEAAVAFRQALHVSSTSLTEQVQILYLLGRTLESLERIPEALEAYRWLRREAPHYRDVAMRIESLSMRRMRRDNSYGQGHSPWAAQALQLWQSLLRSGK
jgi:tetratricopeptide (TPR) repeat protein